MRAAPRLASTLLAGAIGICGCRDTKPTPAAAEGGTPWAAWPMPNAPLPGLPNPHSYDVTSDGVVGDRVTDLMWQRDAPNEFFTFETAQRHCSDLTLAGFDDWRLPSRIELVSLLDTTRIEPSIDASAFPDTANDGFWTATAAANDASAAWYVYFYFGYPKTDQRGNQFSVRCVRTQTPHALPTERYAARTSAVQDIATGLTWQRASPGGAVTFDDATAYCGALTVDGSTGFRLPTLVELLTLVDERSPALMIDAAAFPDTPKEPFWTSSLFGNVPGMAWYVSFDNGSALYGLPTQPARVRCVL